MTASRAYIPFPAYLHHAVFLAALAAAFAFLYHPVLAHILKGWTTLDGSHGPLILGVSLYLVWLKRNELRRMQAEPALLQGGLLLAAGCFIFFAGVISSTLLVQTISIVPVLLGAILLFGGKAFFRELFLPVGYLIFLTGLIEQLLGDFSIYFQNFAAWFAAFFFRLSGIPVYHEQTIIQMPHITLEVARACSGIGHLIALFALAVPLAHLAQKTWPRKIILVVSAFFIGITANGLRVVLIGIYTMFYPDATIHGPYNTFQVAVIFFFGMLLLLLINNTLSRRNGKSERAKIAVDHANGSGENSNDPFGPEGQGARNNPKNNSPGRRRFCAYLTGVFVFALTLAGAHFYTPKSVALERPLTGIPANIAGFTGTAVESVDEALRPFPAHNELLRRYENNEGKTATLYIGYFRIQDRRQKIIDYRRAWMHANESDIAISTGGETFRINKTHFTRHGEHRNVYFWYTMNGWVIRNQYAGKLMTFLNTFFTRTNNAAVIVISTPHQPEELQPFLPRLVKAVDSYLSGI